MKDIRIHYLVDAIPVTRLVEAPGTPRRVTLYGHRMDTLAEVRFNGITSPQVSVLSADSAQALVPPALANRPTHDLKPEVVSSTLSGRANARVVLDLSSQLQEVTGFALLLQIVLRKLMMTPGTNRSAPSEGVGLRGLQGVLVSAGTTGQVEASLYEYVRNTEAQILDMQRDDPRYAPEERLRSLRVSLLSVQTSKASIELGLDVRSEAGVNLNVPLVL